MSDDYLSEKGIDKEKVKEKQERNKKLTIGESAMIPYVIMCIQAIDQNRQKDLANNKVYSIRFKNQNQLFQIIKIKSI